MIKIEWTAPHHWPEIHKICVENIPLFADMTLAEFIQSAFSRQGWTLRNGSKIIGAIALSDYLPGISVMLHVYIDKRYHKQWISRKVLQTVSEFAESVLSVPKMVAVLICGQVEKLERALKTMGFTCETGNAGLRKAYCRNGQFYDLKIYGIFTEECKFLEGDLRCLL